MAAKVSKYNTLMLPSQAATLRTTLSRVSKFLDGWAKSISLGATVSWESWDAYLNNNIDGIKAKGIEEGNYIYFENVGSGEHTIERGVAAKK